MLVRKDNRLAKRKRVNKLKTHSLVSLLVNLSTKICSSVTLSFIYFVYKQLVYSLTRQLNMFLCYFVFYLLCLQATCLLVNSSTRQLEQPLLPRKFWLHIDLTDTTIGTHDWLGIGEAVPAVRGEGLLRGKLLCFLEDKVASVINR